ncbi:MAG: toxin, partial [Chloroflexota bacterium]|nr:toxin [Chloroflexota bacterium]
STHSIWHYEDDLLRLYIQISPGSQGDGEWWAVVDGHAYVSQLRAAGRSALSALFSPELQRLSDEGALIRDFHVPIENTQRPGSTAEQSISFDRRGPYANYNWELFLHTPVLTARYLAQQQRFEDAQRWLHFVFDPTTNDTGSGPARFWRFLPFRQAGQAESIGQLMEWLANPSEERAEEAEVCNQILTWRQEPFRPHAIARMRQSAYQWNTLFMYLDNLLDWGDQLFRRDTREAINEATLLYVLAAKLLGPRPRSMPPRVQAPPLTYRALAGRWDDFGNAWYAFADHPLLKAWQGWLEWIKEHGIVGPQGNTGQTQILNSLGTLYFCVPRNEQLQEYWDKLEDRLFKIRHCRNIEGVERDLALFEPPIDPELLVRATAAGVDIGTVLADRAAPRPHYRFSVLLQNAIQICAELKSLGAALLSALEKQDAEGLALLRSSHEVELLTLGCQIRKDQRDQANADVTALYEARKTAGQRYLHYQRLRGKIGSYVPSEGMQVVEEPVNPRLVASPELWEGEGGLGLTSSEVDQLRRLHEARLFSAIAGSTKVLASAFLFAKALAEPARRDVLEALGQGFNLVAEATDIGTTQSNFWAGRSALLAGYERRRDEWTFQSNSALRELAQIDKQLVAAKVRVAMAEHELSNHDTQVKRAQDVDTFMHDKYTNQALYSWMVDQIADVYFRTYQLAYDMAKRAERAYRFELEPETDGQSFIQSGYWNSLRNGLMSGERLYHDLQRLEAGYLERNRREYELTRHISLRQLDPVALLELKATGSCEVAVPEWLFDLDAPGQYMLRIKNVGLSMPAVTGPYTSLNCTLTLMRSSVRKSALLANSKYVRQGSEDTRFVDYLGPAQSIVTSSGNNDAGM